MRTKSNVARVSTDCTGRLRPVGALIGGAVLAAVAWRAHRGSTGEDRGSGGVLDANGVRRLYNRVAPVYDALAAPYELIGGRRLVKRAITELEVQRGDTVVDLGTGTGWALPRLAEAVGPAGRVVGVDLSTAMLARARGRTRRYANVNLVEADIAEYQLPRGTKAVLAAFAIEMLPDYDQVIARLVDELPPEGRIAVTGLRDPDGWPEWLVRLGSALNRPFGVSADYRHHRPWEAIERHTAAATYTDAMCGAIYLASGSSRPRLTTTRETTAVGGK